ncbi:pyroglutamylated RF-amide peptide receptor-like [Oculina patagonica]
MTGTVLCKLLTHGNVAWIGGAASIITLVAIAIERYYAVVYPFGNKWKLAKTKLKVIIPGIWVFALIFNVPLFLVTDIKKVERENLCGYIWPKDWIAKATSVAWLVMVVLSLAVMAVLYTRAVYTLWFKRNDDNQHTHQQQGVMKVRKRVTLMVIAVTAIFGICWGTSSVVYVLMVAASYDIGAVPIAISNTIVLFNSAFNPFVYALLNQQFREKMKGMIYCTCPTGSVVQPEPLDMELTANTTHPTYTAAPCASE